MLGIPDLAESKERTLGIDQRKVAMSHDFLNQDRIEGRCVRQVRPARPFAMKFNGERSLEFVQKKVTTKGG